MAPKVLESFNVFKNYKVLALRLTFVDQGAGQLIDVEELLEVNIKDEASHEATVEALQDIASDADVTEDAAADEFLVPDDAGEPAAVTATDDDDDTTDVNEERQTNA